MVHALNGDYSTESAHKRILIHELRCVKKNEQPVNNNRSNAFHMV